MTDQDAFLRAIVEHPFDTLTRMVYADWLDENVGEVTCRTCDGDGQVHSHNPICWTCHGRGKVSNGYGERAEFIRLQCDGAEFGYREVKAFSERKFDASWFRDIGRLGVDVVLPWVTPAMPGAVVRNGLVQEIFCSIDWWVGGRCRCNGTLAFAPCRYCRGSGLISSNGPAVVLQQPVTRVVVSDREPWWFVGDREFGWFREDGVANYQPQYNSRRRVGVINSVPAELFALFPRRYGDQTETYPTAEAAVEALSRVLVDWARAKAGLTPIQWEVSQ